MGPSGEGRPRKVHKGSGMIRKTGVLDALKPLCYGLALVVALACSAQSALAQDTDATLAPLTVAAAPPPSTSKDSWQYTVTPYIWFTGLAGSASVGPFGANFNVPTSTILSHLTGVALIEGEAHHDRLGVLADVFYANLKDTKTSQLGLMQNPGSASFTNAMLVVNPDVTYKIIDRDDYSAEILAGVRYWDVSGRLQFTPNTLNLGPYTGNSTWVDPLIGARIKVPFGDKWGAYYWGDIAVGGGSARDWQTIGAATYKGSVATTYSLGYRYLYDLKTNGGNVAVNMSIKGPFVGFTFKLK